MGPDSWKVSEATISGMLKTYDLNISNSLKSLGTTTLANTNINGDLTVDGTMSINGNSINTLGNLSNLGILYLQNSPLSQGLDIFNGKVKIDKNGNITTQGEITVKKLSVSADSAGTGIIPAGKLSVEISSSSVTINSKLFVTPKKPVVIAVTDQNPANHTFVVELDSAKTTDIKFDWWIVDTTGKNSIKYHVSSIMQEESSSSSSWQNNKNLGTVEAVESISSSVKVMANPNSSSEDLTQIIPGTKFYIQEEKNGWVKIEYQPDVYGWVLESLINRL